MHKILKILILITIFISLANTIEANTARELGDQIDTQKNKILELDKEIERQRTEVLKINSQASTLSQAVNSLKASENILSNNISKTQSVINKTELTIQKLEIESRTKEEIIQSQKDIISQSLRRQYQSESETLVENFLTSKTFSEIWNDIETIGMFNNGLKERIITVENERAELLNIKKEEEVEKTVLIEEKETLAIEQESISYAKAEKDKLLKSTQNKESEYRRILQDKINQKIAFEKELFAYESQLKEALSKNDIPQESSLLSWPLSNVRITQKFGKTSSSGRLYASGTHNGVDMGTSVGTKVLSAATGKVIGSGNTDQYPGCWSYGKWVLVEHGNGLSTLYAHLSSIKVSNGDIVGRGETLGLSGNTGYSTGPHLHMTLFASKGVSVSKYSQSSGCKQASIPLPTKQNAYLDPMAYLEKL
jgi:murein DD-endopeptidase MepM/ murein hydrolase activator NlpD